MVTSQGCMSMLAYPILGLSNMLGMVKGTLLPCSGSENENGYEDRLPLNFMPGFLSIKKTRKARGRERSHVGPRQEAL